MQSALVNKETMLVENIIVADPAVDANPDPDRYLFIGDVDIMKVSIGTAYDGEKFAESPPPEEVIKFDIGTSQAPAIDGLETI